MKKSILALSVTALLFSCKKETTPAAFTPTDNTGTAYVKGNVTKNVVAPTGNGGWTQTGRVVAKGVNVTVRILKSQLYPNSNNLQGADVYTGVTDANGNYNIAVKSNGNGVQANIVIDGFASTLDTLINGNLKPGLYATYIGSNTQKNVFINQTTEYDYQFNATNVTSNPNNLTIGTAIVTGSVGMGIVKEMITVQTSTAGPASGTVYPFGTIPVPAGTKVYLDFNMDPLNLATKSYIATTDANGMYSFTLSTVAAGTAGFNQNANIWIADYATTLDTIRVTTTLNNMTVVSSTTSTPVTGKPGVYGNTATGQGALFNNEIRNAVNLYYSAGSFVYN